jgi:uncharacterized membrane-anchored protein
VLRRLVRDRAHASIHTVNTRRREVFYWLTVMLTFALGTAAGDLTGFCFDLGFVHSALLFGAAVLVPWLLHRFAGLNAIAAFWASYVLTRPGTTAILAALVCAALVGYLALSHPRAAHDTPGLSPATLP